MMPGGMMGGWGYGFFGWLMMLLFWGLIIAGAVLVIRWLVDQTRSPALGSETALDVLKRRYAKGEITKEQFDAMKRDLA
ncbi:MAG: SHOCT domain-containing protein [candidate division NC10 bacterium]|nr:SHOCT domain-containing protein [candidate division NC10 bacterium]